MVGTRQDHSQDFPAFSAKISVRFKTHASATFHEGCEKSLNPELGSSLLRLQTLVATPPPHKATRTWGTGGRDFFVCFNLLDVKWISSAFSCQVHVMSISWLFLEHERSYSFFFFHLSPRIRLSKNVPWLIEVISLDFDHNWLFVFFHVKSWGFELSFWRMPFETVCSCCLMSTAW